MSNCPGVDNLVRQKNIGGEKYNIPQELKHENNSENDTKEQKRK
jgi:hypothetical protein